MSNRADKISGGCELVFPKSLSHGEIEEARRKLTGLSDGLAQQLLDELSARVESGAVHHSPLAYLRGLVKRAITGNFTPETGIAIAAARQQRRATQEACKRAELSAPTLPPADESNPLVQRLMHARKALNHQAIGEDISTQTESTDQLLTSK